MSSTPEWDGVERRADPRFELVERAAAAAAQQVAAIHRRRLVTQSFIAALTAAALVALPVALVVNHQRVADAKRSATFNCRRSNEIADVFGDFIASDAKLRVAQRNYEHRAQVQQALHRLIAPKVLRDIEHDSLVRDQHATEFWTGSLLPRLREAANIDCGAVIK